MHYRRLGTSGLQLSVLSLGSEHFSCLSRDEARNLVAAAWDQGMNAFDSMERCSPEQQVLGDVIKDLRLPRDGFCISSTVISNFHFPECTNPLQCGLSRKHIYDSCHAALRRLHVDYLDLYYCLGVDPEVPLVETVQAMDHLIRQGKVLYWGMIGWPPALINETITIAHAQQLQPPTMMQLPHSPFHRADYAALLSESGLGMIAMDECDFYPHGLSREHQIQFNAFSMALGVSTDQLYFAWCLHNRQLSSVVLYPPDVSDLQKSLQALELEQQLDPAIWLQIEAIFAENTEN